MLILVGCAKLVAIGVTVLAGYRGGFIFPFMVSGVAIGCGFARAGADAGLLRGAVAEPLCALCLAAGINTCVTRTVLATPIVLVSISDRVDALPVALSRVSSRCTDAGRARHQGRAHARLVRRSRWPRRAREAAAVQAAAGG